MAKLLIWLKRLWHSVYRPDKVMYIGGSDTLPPPLPRDEESVLLEKLNTGDFQVRQTLIEHNLRLVVYIARRFENTGIHIEDLISIGTIGLSRRSIRSGQIRISSWLPTPRGVLRMKFSCTCGRTAHNGQRSASMSR